MLIFRAPAALVLYLAALLLTAAGVFWKKGAFLTYLGGICWAAGTFAARLFGVPLQEILVVTLIFLSVGALRFGKEESK